MVLTRPVSWPPPQPVAEEGKNLIDDHLGWCVAAYDLFPGGTLRHRVVAVAVALAGLTFMVMIALLGVGLGPLFAGVSRAALNAVPQSVHGRVSALISAGRLVGASLGAVLTGLALRGGVDAAHVRPALTAGAVM